MTNLSLWRDRNPQKSLIDEVFGFFDETDQFGRHRLAASRDSLFSVACDIKETKNEYLLTFDIPGLSKDDIHIDIKNNHLMVSGERSHEEKTEDEQVYRIERSYGKFQRSFELPEGVDVDHVQAGYENGVLKIAIPKGEVGKSRKVKIGDSTKGFLKKLTTKHEPHSKAVNS